VPAFSHVGSLNRVLPPAEINAICSVIAAASAIVPPTKHATAGEPTAAAPPRSEDLARLREAAADGDRDAADQLVEFAEERRDLDELRRLADSGNDDAVGILVELAGDREDFEELRDVRLRAAATPGTFWPNCSETTTPPSRRVEARRGWGTAGFRASRPPLRPSRRPRRCDSGTPRAN
jgi:hypothetical protein